MKLKPSNLVLIGMPGSGKSTVGVILAKKAIRGFVDTDVLIQTSQKRTLQEIVDTDGYVALRKIEAEQILGLNVRNHVIATGGSAVYSHQAMTHLKSSGLVIFLDADVATLESRVLDFSMRGLAKRPGQSLSDLFEERYPLYAKYADIIIRCSELTQDGVCSRIIEKMDG
jgi:shikimate kinase